MKTDRQQTYLATRAANPRATAAAVLAAIRGDANAIARVTVTRYREPRGIVYNRRFDSGSRSFQHVRWIENASQGMRRVGFADEIRDESRLRGYAVDHQGWFTDDDGLGEVYRGIVYRLPRDRFAYGFADPNNDDAALLCFDNDAVDEAEAARYADGLAEVYAEREREHRRNWQAARRVEDLRERIKAARAEHSAIVTEIRAVRAEFPSIEAPRACMALRKQLRTIYDSVADAAREIRETLDTYGAEILGAEYQ